MASKQKLNISKLISKLKNAETGKNKNLKDPISSVKERDMRREAMDMGSHQASEMWGENERPGEGNIL